jgi:hypothetical protein
VARGRRQERIVAAFEALSDAVARALGAADGARDAAVSAHAEAMAEMWLRTEGLDAARADPGLRGLLTNPRLAAVVERVATDRAAAFGGWLEHGPRELAGLLAEAAPGAAGAPPQEWLGDVGEVDGSGPVPTLWRIGTGTIGPAVAPAREPLGGGVSLGNRSAGTAVALTKTPAAATVGGAFPVAVPLLDESHLQIHSTHDGREMAESLLETLLMRVVSHFRPGMVAVHVWDVGQFTGSLPGLYPLTRTGVLSVHDPGRLPQLLEELSDRIRRVHTRVLVDGHPSLRALADATGGREEPWIVAVLVGNRAALGEEDHRQLQRVARGGLACGIQLVLLDVPMTVNAPVETVAVRDEVGTATSSMTGSHVTVTIDPPLEGAAVVSACHKIADAHEHWRSRIGTFADLLPDGEWGAEQSRSGLHAPVGFADGRKVEITLADTSPHALIGGPSGSGKTNLLLAMISSLTSRYSPRELELYLLDFKEGVSFAQFTPGSKDPTWLPHARLVGVNINTDREFGLALLQFLAEEMRRRSQVAKSHEVTKLEELRAVDDGVWPRIVAVIDEFQYLFAERDAVTRAAIGLLEDVARRGRSQGIHLVLASQDVSGIEAFWARPAIFEQFVLRIGLPRARRLLAHLNEATMDLPRWHAVINHESGVTHGNEIVRIPNATAPGSVDAVQRRLHERYSEGRSQPRLFDGSRAPLLIDLLRAMDTADTVPDALVGQCIDVAGSPATARLPDVPGRNLGVLAAGTAEAVRVLGAAATSFAVEHPPGALDVVIAPLVAEAVDPARQLTDRCADAGQEVRTVWLGGLREQLDALAADIAARLAGDTGRPVALVLYAADAAETVLGRDGIEALRKVLRFGPETGVHVLGWWRSVQRLKSLLMMSASIDDLGAWVALDVQGSELQSLVPGLVLNWAPRPGRGLFFDRAQHAAPEVVIVPSLDEPS